MNTSVQQGGVYKRNLQIYLTMLLLHMNYTSSIENEHKNDNTELKQSQKIHVYICKKCPETKDNNNNNKQLIFSSMQCLQKRLLWNSEGSFFKP